jgi:hypothetical protein
MAGSLRCHRLKVSGRDLRPFAARLTIPEDRCYHEVREGHFVYLKPVEERFLSESLIRCAGLVVTNGCELIEEFSREVIARYR